MDNREGVVSSIGEKRHGERFNDRDVCQVPCRSTSSFLSDTFFRPAYTLTHWSSEDGTAVWGVLEVLSSWG